MNAKTLKYIVAVGIVAVLVVISIHRRAVRVDDYSMDFMGTNTHIVALAESEKNAKDAIVAAEVELGRIEKMMSYHASDSELSRINKVSFGEPVKLEPELFDVITRAIYYSELSAGRFDITIGPLIDLWKNAKTMPSDDDIAMAKSKVGYQNIIIDAENLTIRFKIEGMKIDLGGIAKGYAIDRAIDVLKANGCKGGLVDIGGDMRCFGVSPKGRGYTIALQNPKAVADSSVAEYLMIFKVNDMAVATSGDYQRYVEIDGQRISHILDVKTLKGAARYASVTVIAEKAIDADALATTISLMGPDEAIKLVDKLENTEVILMEKQSEKLFHTSGIGKYIK